MSVSVGQVLDKYELLERVGQGGMSVVYRGVDQTLNREVAIKVLHEHLADHPEAKERFEREAKAVAKLRHDNILEIYAFSGKDSKDSYIVAEFIDGTNLAQFLESHQIVHSEIAAMILVQVCAALFHAHSAQVLHRDIKPENIMIRNDGILKLTDFGIAQMLDHKKVTMTGQLLGSPAYMSPEHVNGEVLDVRTDIFSAGIVLYQLITGQLPFAGNNAHQVLRQVDECDFEDPQVRNAGLSAHLRKITLKALARDPSKRFQDALSFQSALLEFLTDSGLEHVKVELREFFKAPTRYESTLRDRLISHLSQRGKQLQKSDPLKSIDCFHRVLALDPDNEEVRRSLKEAHRKKRTRAFFYAACGAALLFWFVQAIIPERRPTQPPGPSLLPLPSLVSESPLPDAPFSLLENLDAPVDAPIPERDSPVVQPRFPTSRQPTPKNEVVPVTFEIFPRGSKIQIDNGPWENVPGTRFTRPLAAGNYKIQVRNPCCQNRTFSLPVASEPIVKPINLGWLPATVTPRCEKDARVTLDGRPIALDKGATVPIQTTLGERPAKVVFLHADYGTSEKNIRLRYGMAVEVSCDYSE